MEPSTPVLPTQVTPPDLALSDAAPHAILGVEVVAVPVLPGDDDTGPALGPGAEELSEVRIELPVDAHLPHDYIGSERLRLEIYKRLAEVRSDEDVDAIEEELKDRYGELPIVVVSLLLVARFRARARAAGIGEVTIAGKNVRFAPVSLPDSRVVRLQRMYPKSLVKPQTDTILVPRPQTAVIGGKPLDGIALLEWAKGVIDQVIDPPAAS